MEKYRIKHKKRFSSKRKKSFLKTRFFWLLLLFLFFSGAVVYSIFSFKFFEVKEISILGSQKIKTEELASFIQEKIKHKIVFFETKSIFLADLGKIKEETLKRFILISKIDLNKDFSGRITANIKEREPIGVLCSFADCYYFDINGVAFEKTEEKMPVLIKTDLKEIKNATAILEIERMLREDFEIAADSFSLDAEQKKLDVLTKEGWKALFNFNSNMDSQIFNLQTVLKEQIPSDKRKSLDYIDLRFGNKVFYK